MKTNKIITIGIVFFLIVICSSCGKKSAEKQGLSAYKSGNYQTAIEYFQAAIAEDSTKVDNYVYLGMCYLTLEDYENAKKTFNLGKNLKPSEEMLNRGLGLVEYYQENYEEAIEYFNEALNEAGISITDTEIDILMYRAKAQTELKQYEEAKNSYNTLLKAESESGELYYNRGCLWLELGELEDAQNDFAKAIELEDSSYALYWNIYQKLADHDYKDQAQQYIDLALELPVKDDSSYKYRAFFLYLNEDYEKAITEFLKLNELDLQSVVCLANSYSQCNEKEKAIDIFKEAIENNSSNLEFYNQFGLFLIEQGDGKNAIKWLKKGIKLGSSPDTKEMEYNLIIAYERLENYKTAMEKLKLYENTYGVSDMLEKEEEFLKTRLS